MGEGDHVVGRPAELQEYEVIDALCSRFGYTPEQAVAAPAWVLRMADALNLAHPPEEVAS